MRPFSKLSALPAATKSVFATAVVFAIFGTASPVFAQQGSLNYGTQAPGASQSHGVDFKAMKGDLTFKTKRKIKVPLKRNTQPVLDRAAFDRARRGNRCVDCE